MRRRVFAPSTVKGEPSARSASDLQHSSVTQELAFLRKNFRDLMAAYAAQVECEITALLDTVRSDAESGRRLPAARAYDLRDMLFLLRNLDVKPAKGRRRDLKKVEGLIEELRRIAERWG